MPGDKGSKKDEGDFDLEDDHDVTSDPSIRVEEEMADLAEKRAKEERTTQREMPAYTKASIPAPQKSSSAGKIGGAAEGQKITVEKTITRSPPPSEKKTYKEPVPTSTEDIYKAMKKPNSYGFMRKIIFVALAAAGIFYGQRFIERTKELVPFPDNPNAQKEPPGKSISGQIADLQKQFLEKEEKILPVEVFVDSDFVDIQVLVNGRAITMADKKFSVDSGQTYKIVMKRNGFFDYQTEVTAEAGVPLKIVPQFNKEYVSGFVTVETTPESKYTITQDGTVLKEGNTPLVGWKAPVGKYRLTIENSFIGYRAEEDFVIYNSVTTSIRRELNAK